MKNLLLLTLCGALALTGCSSGPKAAASKQPANAGIIAVSGDGSSTNDLALLPKSMFHSGPQSGRDPFFPGASRHNENERAAGMSLPAISYLKLVGIRPGTTRPMALINRTPFSPGEEGDVSIVVTNQFNKPEVQKVAVRCLEVRQDSVLISIAGEQGVKELRIAQNK